MLFKKEINNNLQNILNEIQQNKIDPIGLSLYARAFQYKEWKKSKRRLVASVSRG